MYTPSGHTPRSILVRIATAVYPEISAKRSIVTLSIMSVVLGLSAPIFHEHAPVRSLAASRAEQRLMWRELEHLRE